MRTRALVVVTLLEVTARFSQEKVMKERVTKNLSLPGRGCEHLCVEGFVSNGDVGRSNWASDNPVEHSPDTPCRYRHEACDDGPTHTVLTPSGEYNVLRSVLWGVRASRHLPHICGSPGESPDKGGLSSTGSPPNRILVSRPLGREARVGGEGGLRDGARDTDGSKGSVGIG